MNLKEFKMEIKMTTKPKKPVMPDFENIQVSTKTVIAKTNARYDIQKLFENLPVAPYTVVKKKRGRKKNIFVPDPNENVPSGSIITLKYFEHLRGVDLKPKKRQGNQSHSEVKRKLGSGNGQRKPRPNTGKGGISPHKVRIRVAQSEKGQKLQGPRL